MVPLEHAPRGLAKAEFDLLVPPPRSRMVISAGIAGSLDDVYRLIARHVPPPYAPAETLRQAMDQNRDVLSVFSRDGAVLGFHAALFLNPLGLERLLLGEFDTLKPDSAAMAGHGEVPAAIYLWLAVCPGRAAEGLMHVAQRLRHPAFARANLFSKPVTPDGERQLLAFGYRRLACGTPNLHRYIRLANRPGDARRAA